MGCGESHSRLLQLRRGPSHRTAQAPAIHQDARRNADGRGRHRQRLQVLSAEHACGRHRHQPENARTRGPKSARVFRIHRTARDGRLRPRIPGFDFRHNSDGFHFLLGAEARCRPTRAPPCVEARRPAHHDRTRSQRDRTTRYLHGYHDPTDQPGWSEPQSGYSR